MLVLKTDITFCDFYTKKQLLLRLLFLFITLLGYSAQAQQTNVSLLLRGGDLYLKNISVAYAGGFLPPHRTEVKHLEGHTRHTELRVTPNIAFGPWYDSLKRPDIHVSLLYQPFPHKNILGTAWAVALGIEATLWRLSPRSRLTLNPALGAAWLSHTFTKDNLTNVAIGSHLNYCVRLQTALLYDVTQSFGVAAEAGINHFSNGSFNKPNLGLNVIHGGFRAIYYLQSAETRPTKIASPYLFNKKWGGMILPVVGLKENGLPGGHRFLVVGGRAVATVQLSRQSRMLAGIDVNKRSFIIFGNDDRLPVSGEPDNEFPHPPEELLNTTVSVMTGYEWLLGRFALLGHIGVYVARPAIQEELPFYQRYGFKYYFSKHFFAEAALRSHAGRADYTEVGLGFWF